MSGRITDEEEKELNEVESQFVKKMAELLFKGIKRDVEQGGFVDNYSAITLIERDLYSVTLPKVVGELDKLLRADPELLEKNRLAGEKYYTEELEDQLKTADQPKAFSNFVTPGDLITKKLN